MTSPSDLPSHATRRDFLKTSSALALGGAVASQLVFPAGAHAGADDTIKIALIGCGGRGTGAAVQALKTQGKVQLVAMGDAFEDRLEGSLKNIGGQGLAADRVDVPKDRRFVGFDAYQKIMAMPEVKLVILATPPGFRPIHLEAAVAAGKNVFMEKPVAVDGPGVRKVVEASRKAKEQGLAIGVGLQRRHEAKYLDVIKRLQDGAIGDMVAARVYWNGAGVWVNPRKQGQTDMEYQMRNWYYFNWLCGDHIVEQHIHNLDVINWLKNAYPVRCLGMGGRQVRVQEQYGEIYDHFACEYEYADGSRMFSQCRHIPSCWNSVTEHVHGTKGTSDISGGRIAATGGEDYRYRGKGDGNPYQVEHDVLFESIRKSNPINEGEYGAYSSLTAIMGRMATYSGKEVTWDAALNSQLSLGPTEYTWDAKVPEPKVATPGQTQAL